MAISDVAERVDSCLSQRGLAYVYVPTRFDGDRSFSKPAGAGAGARKPRFRD